MKDMGSAKSQSQLRRAAVARNRRICMRKRLELWSVRLRFQVSPNIFNIVSIKYIWSVQEELFTRINLVNWVTGLWTKCCFPNGTIMLKIIGCPTPRPPYFIGRLQPVAIVYQTYRCQPIERKAFSPGVQQIFKRGRNPTLQALEAVGIAAASRCRFASQWKLCHLQIWVTVEWYNVWIREGCLFNNVLKIVPSATTCYLTVFLIIINLQKYSTE